MMVSSHENVRESLILLLKNIFLRTTREARGGVGDLVPSLLAILKILGNWVDPL